MISFTCANFDVSKVGDKNSVPEKQLVWISQLIGYFRVMVLVKPICFSLKNLLCVTTEIMRLRKLRSLCVSFT